MLVSSVIFFSFIFCNEIFLQSRVPNSTSHRPTYHFIARTLDSREFEFLISANLAAQIVKWRVRTTRRWLALCNGRNRRKGGEINLQTRHPFQRTLFRIFSELNGKRRAKIWKSFFVLFERKTVSFGRLISKGKVTQPSTFKQPSISLLSFLVMSLKSSKCVKTFNFSFLF